MLERIGNCRIVEEVASGGMAVVYRAIQDELNRTVAIKALKTAAAQEEQIVTRFEREAQSLAQLQHENIIHVYDFHRERGALFIVMEYVQGIDLYDLLDKCGRFPFDVAAIVALQIARALDYVHYRGILHRDIKPANVMISRQGGVKLMDFGIAQDKSFTDLTEAGTGIGTPAYMSPEQIIGDRLDARSDLFSLGIVLYQMVTGRKPFIEDEERSVMHKIRIERHESPRKLNPDLPRELERIIDKCLYKQPRDRWRSAQHMVMALERFLAKHVEMNYHTRLVVFLRNQGVIPQYEADEYLNPSLGGDSTPNPTNLAARQLIRRSLIVHGAIFVVVALMISIIHLAPFGAATAGVVTGGSAPSLGHVRVVVHPWGEVAIDGEPAGVTPMAEPLEVPVGTHRFTITNEFFEPLSREVEVRRSPEDRPQELFVNLEEEAVKRGQGGDAASGPAAGTEAAPEAGDDDAADANGAGDDDADGDDSPEAPDDE